MQLNIENLHVRYPGQPHPAVASVNIALAAGEIGVLIGPSGCGKTTLLRAVAGLQPIERGAIVLAGETVSSPSRVVAPERRQIGMLFQDYALFPHLNVAANVGFGLHGQVVAARESRVDEVLELVGLSDTRHRFPHELSGGQQQRVALARALAPRPRLLLLDEPFSSLDVDLRERLAHEIRNILKLAGTTALMVTHDQLEAFAVGDAIGVMHQGALLQWGSAYELYHQPVTRFVADFIGHGVFIQAQVMAGAAHRRIESALGSLDGLSPTAADGLQLGEIDVLVRADDIVHDDDSIIVAQILRKTFRGSEFLYTLKLKSGEAVVVHVPSHHDHAIGEWIGIRVEMNHLVAFARETAGNPERVASL